MMEHTDLDRVKKVAESFLDTDLKIKREGEVTVVSHPFFNRDVVIERLPKTTDDPTSLADCKFLLITENPADLERAKELQRKSINKCDSVSSLFLLICKGYRFAFLDCVKDLLSRDDLSDVLQWIWKSGENTSKQRDVSKTKLIKLFESCNPQILMGPEEYEAFLKFPDELTIYRGIEYDEKGPKKAMIRALSWTPELDTAIFFAKRFLMIDGRIGAVYKAKIKKADVLTYYAGEESEVLVKPQKLYDIELVQEYHKDEE